MRLLMLETRRGSADGRSVMLYERGKTYDLPSALAHAFLAAGFATPPPREGKIRAVRTHERRKRPTKESL